MEEQNPCLKNGCSVCCRNTQMPLTNEDAKRISAISGLNINEFAIKNDGFLQLVNNPKTKACVFLKTNSDEISASGICSIHDFRPRGCQIYPVIIGENEKIITDEICPQREKFTHTIEKFEDLLLKLDKQIEAEKS
jgi:Fe-S-cluster containining protein